jgi:predicted nucleic acid-binding protein
MKSCVVDASVVAAAFFQEQYADEARKLLTSGTQLLAPDLIHCELANVIWKRQQRGEIDAAEAMELLDDSRALPLRIVSSGGLMDAALRLAIQSRRTVYDCLYLAVAISHKCAMATCDRRLVNALKGTPVEAHAVWIAEV